MDDILKFIYYRAMKIKVLFALDFDGVICDSAVETAITGWSVAQDIWPDMQGQKVSDKHIKQFRRVRPCLDVGYEAILIMRLLQQGDHLSDSCENYQSQLQSVIEKNNLDVEFLKNTFGETRDSLILKDEAEWVASNPLFNGVIDGLKRLEQDDWVIVTTKQERFVKRILQANSIQLDEDRIFGLDRKLDKQEVLKLLIERYPERRISFVEDRLPTLLGVLDNPYLQDVKVQLVDWGYNTRLERKVAQERAIEVIGKSGFLQTL